MNDDCIQLGLKNLPIFLNLMICLMQNSKNKITAIIRLMQEGCLPDDVPPPDCSDYEHNTFIPHPFSKCYNL